MDAASLDKTNIVAFIGDIFNRRGAEAYLGENVTISQHMLQCALLAQKTGADDALVAAALLHDIGHFTSEFGEDAADKGIDAVHETAGADVLAAFFPEVVTECVRQHVAAKRYLCATNPTYFDRLSQASVLSLKLQGGPMDEAECETFAQNRHLKAIIKVRYWDEAGKDPDMQTPPFEHYAPLLQRVVDG